MTLNIENLQFIRSLIEAAPPEHSIMSHWGGYCGTACCIGGWTELAYRIKEDPETKLYNVDVTTHSLTEFLGMKRRDFNNITAMCTFEDGVGFSMMGFDRQNKPEVRKAVLLTVFDQLIETGKWDWEAALTAHGATADYQQETCA